MRESLVARVRRGTVIVGVALATGAAALGIAPPASASGIGDCVSNKACGWVDANWGGSTTWTAAVNANYSLPVTFDNKFSSVKSVHSGCAFYRDFSGDATNIHLAQNYQIADLNVSFPQLQDKISYVQVQSGAC